VQGSRAIARWARYQAAYWQLLGTRVMPSVIPKADVQSAAVA
jgi:hypothetical protein